MILYVVIYFNIINKILHKNLRIRIGKEDIVKCNQNERIFCVAGALR